MYQVTKLHYHRISKMLDIHFDDDLVVALSSEFLRTHSPSAEVQGHGPSQQQLVLNKQDVQISQLEPVGHYAVRLCFDDGHNSGLFSWQYLRKLCTEHASLWSAYQQRVEAHHQSKNSVPIKFIP
ncbi:gamma-butyrobetaine hydroxylase-like domain-containing protein [Pseudoalteromonas luteoviolacea]|uniref:Gamma-butyrobetaine hydroxylase-like N-terminal domain-containing protein n=1 Tax=Pseudoalteromonas luteoviolacea DSM 6061 TaxID=1365250 RepID=A0A166UXS0_9GAMM|nr:gamma-butyrobetaine hydroxylase-like domain-containing protein [Pseudoalteromonas luteoviolacea]KZN31492.1 hypothetical protein N475_23415 [Pseudoalteromonas luteoviolacea DSM 6061]KZN55941.1 hypothetical protein N474_13655 [Pseudoalteromonas luteoviolacea CPMOR-2]MBE0388156.1 hypothetical protein [Pseudoalteromonas luteoviolacea DSM 6061]TQF72832.1 DUF971 domain-containing protein [Pseudoalteromonas luteoviolacea]